MKPLFLCPACKNETRWGDRHCSSCGKPLEWPSGTGSEESREHAHQPSQGRSDKRKVQIGPAVSWKMMVGFALFLVGGVVVLELLTGTGNIPTPVAPSEPAGASANMEAMNHLTELERQVAASPENAELRLHLANFAHDNRFYDKAIEHYKAYLRSKPRDPDALVDLGICYNDIGQLDEAKSLMNEALEVSPKHVLAHFNLGIVNLKGGDVETANSWFEKAYKLSPDSEIGKRAQQLLSQHGNLGNP